VFFLSPCFTSPGAEPAANLAVLGKVPVEIKDGKPKNISLKPLTN